MSAAEAFSWYREVGTIGLPVSNVRNPGKFSAENLILFSITAYFMGGIPAGDVHSFIAACRLKPGLFVRYPGMPDKYCSHDDLTAMAVFDQRLAREIYDYGEANGWTWPGVGYLPRIQDFKATIKAGAEVPPTTTELIQATIAVLWDAFWRTTNKYDGKPDVGGSLLIYLKQKKLDGIVWYLDWAFAIWRWRMKRIFGELWQMYAIYFGADSPFCTFSPKEFGNPK